jgi:hypothetical protein
MYESPDVQLCVYVSFEGIEKSVRLLHVPGIVEIVFEKHSLTAMYTRAERTRAP